MFDTFRIKDRVGAVSGKARGAADRVSFRSDILIEVRDKAGKLKSSSFQHNLRTNAGADFWDSQLFKVGAAAATANFIALTVDATAPAATDTTLASEETLNGLARAQAADAHTAGASSSVLTKTFTYTGSSSKVIAKLGLFNASSAGTLVLETLLASTATVNANGDTISITWTINY
jgi:hypothetical protein